uniref:DNA repair nuclease/redox regulator APEX1 n=1 Tax=Arion vulgaris TaxID=1028688 RepID=A0A0B7A5W0_9EUPU
MPPKGRKRAAEDDSKKETATEEEVGDSAEAEEKKEAPAKSQNRKRKAEAANGDETVEPKPKLKPKSSISDSFTDVDFSAKAKTPSGKEANFKIASWNVNGLRAWLEKDGVSYIKAEDPDIVCLQELKCDVSIIPEEAQVEGYTTHWLSGDTEGYSGVGIYYKTKPIKVTEGIGHEKHDKEGRAITAEFDKFFLVNVYVPNSGRGLPRLDYRTKEWDVDFRKYLKSLDEKKPVILCGDLNVAHHEIDIRNPKGNKKTAGFTIEERESFTTTLREGFVDSFRHLYPHTENAFTFWTYMMNARAKNAGWRLDYFVLSERLKENLCDSIIRSKVTGSDHCPIVLQLAL